MSLPVAILAGGLATRLRPVTEHIPKALVEVAGRPFAEHQIELLQRHGITDIVFLLGHLGEMVEAALGDGSRWGVRITYAHDGPRPLGTGGALRAALEHLGDPFFVLYGDSYLECDYRSIERSFHESRQSALMTVCRNDDRWDRSNVLFRDGRILAYTKEHPTPEMHHIDYGLGVFRKEAFAAWGPGDRFELSEVYRRLLASDDLAAFEVEGRFYEIGSHAGLSETDAYIQHRDATRASTANRRTRAVFLDRDGVITRAEVRDGKPYAPRSEHELEILPEALAALERLHEAGFRLIVVTNQPDVARGALDRQVLERMHSRLSAELPLDEIRTCEHDDADACECRKPKAGLLVKAAAEGHVSLADSFMVGDRWRDVEAGRAAGCTTIFIDRGYRERQPDHPDVIVSSLAQAADWILTRHLSRPNG